MGATVMEIPRARHMGTHIDHLASQHVIRLNSGPAIVEGEEQARNALKAVDEVVNIAISEWSKDLLELEQNPQDYINLCLGGNVERSIKALDQLSHSLRSSDWIRLGELAKQYSPILYEPFKKVDDRLLVFITILQEISWNLSILHKADNLDASQFILVE